MSGRIVILNGAPRAGKSSIAKAVQENLPGHWISLGVDAQNRSLPQALLPGIGLRPGGERPDLEPVVQRLYAALYESIAAHARHGFDVVADVGHHDAYSTPLVKENLGTEGKTEMSAFFQRRIDHYGGIQIRKQTGVFLARDPL